MNPKTAIVNDLPTINKEMQQESYFRQIDRLVERWEEGEVEEEDYKQEYFRLMAATGLLDIPENKELKEQLENNL